MEALRDKIATHLRSELVESEEERWYYISMEDGKVFRGGFLIRGYGPTDVWIRFHGLNLLEYDCSTETSGPIDKEKMKKVPSEKRWCKLTLEEIKNLFS